jgi:hypothetical protein
MRNLLLKGSGNRIMQFRFDREPIPGALEIDGFIEIHSDTPDNRAAPELTVTPEDVASLILERLPQFSMMPDVIRGPHQGADCIIHKHKKRSSAKDPILAWFGSSIRQNTKTMSLLAIVETLTASAVTMYATVVWGATIWFAAYILIAPLLLLKTKGSVKRGLKYGHSLVRVIAPVIIWTWSQVERSKSVLSAVLLNLVHFIACVIFFTIVVVSAPIVKIAATLREWPRNWLLPLRRLPKNWSAICLQTDLTMLPELLPGSSNLASIRGMQSQPNCTDANWVGANAPIFRKGKFPEFLRTQHQNGVMFSLQAMIGGLSSSKQSVYEQIWSSILMLPAILGIVFFGLAYRWALKATAFFWAPLLFFSQVVFRKSDSLEWRIAEIIDIPYSKAQRVWAIVIILVHLIIPMYCWHCFVEFTRDWVHSSPQMSHILRYLFVTEASAATDSPILPWIVTIKLWHIAAIIGAGITWVMWKLAYDYRLALGQKKLSSEKELRALKTIQVCLFTRAICMTFSLFCLTDAMFKTLIGWYPIPHIILFP